MKRMIIKSLFGIGLFLTIGYARPGFDINFNVFYNELSPYGEWIDFDDNLIVWRPDNVDRNWKPYSMGRWRWTGDGWYWDSYEPFGWATYHYGRWHFDDYYGWVWMPDYDWAPAWVEWRYSSDYIGWAPLPPYAKFRRGYGISFSIHWRSPHNHWHFVNINHFCHHNVYNYYIHNDDHRKIFNRTRVRHDYYDRDGRVFNRGIERDFIEHRTRSRIEESRTVETRDRDIFNQRERSNDSDIKIYRPERSRSNNNEYSIRRGERSISIERDKIEVSRTRETGDRNNRRNDGTNSEIRSRNNDGQNILRERSNNSGNNSSLDIRKRNTLENVNDNSRERSNNSLENKSNEIRKREYYENREKESRINELNRNRNNSENNVEKRFDSRENTGNRESNIRERMNSGRTDNIERSERQRETQSAPPGDRRDNESRSRSRIR